MSQWVHVSGLIRLDSLVHTSAEQRVKDAFGKTWDFHSPIPDTENVPSGSEGSIQYTVEYVGHQDEYGRSLVCSNVSLWGDLCDVGEECVQAVVQWVQKSLEKLMINSVLCIFARSVCILVEVESGSETLITLSPDSELGNVKLTCIKLNVQ